ncbi:FAD-dependent oxidoreductase [Nonlabens sp. SY33080]|uniref:FAD-dependent oxidoreductase n=1 Tax=Nonlabens sp. SY33080 TaxID=2719911 RepID=UPI001428AD6E|nr:FAD-dependent oxidoreductase [Nonlabens sp. SY33080]
MENKKIVIIGAGVSGLVAAQTLKNQGYEPIIFEKNTHPGGRVHTIVENNVILDLGFQVMLDEYPAVKDYLDTSSLDLIKFAPGAVIFKDGRTYKLGDASRDLNFLLPTIFAGIGTLGDKWKVFTLSRKLKQKSLSDIFSTPEITTEQYLKDYGFSDKIIENFFRPFYAGIFLEDKLETSSRMFEFVFKMFATGNATIPARGIKAIPEQLANDIDINYNKELLEVVGNQLTFKDGSQVQSDYTIVATPASDVVPNLRNQQQDWKQTTVFYFKTDHEGFKQPIIGLLTGNGYANNFHFLHDVFPNHQKVISITVVKDYTQTEEELSSLLAQELKQETGIELGDMIKYFKIKKALPVLNNLNYALPSTETQLTQHVFLAGDHLSNSSLNAAMLNGAAAAQAVIDKAENRVVVG